MMKLKLETLKVKSFLIPISGQFIRGGGDDEPSDEINTGIPATAPNVTSNIFCTVAPKTKPD